MMIGILLALATSTIVPAGPWTELSRHDGVVVHTRPVVGTAFVEFRATVEVPIPAPAMLDVIWDNGARRDPSPNVTTNELLDDAPDRRRAYQVATAPVVDPRDYVLETTRHRDEGTIRFRSVEDARRPPREGVVRIPRIVGSIAVTPLDDGRRCTVVYTVFSETGGQVPAWLARNGQRDNMLVRLQALRRRALEARP